jgi:hypothetical protein
VEYFIRQPSDAWRGYAIKWDGEWQITYETFRDMGAAYAVGLILIYLLVVAQFGSYLTPLIIMAPIPLTIIGVMPGHALLGAQYTATSMIGMIALAGIIVRNSILLVDFINLQVREGTPTSSAIVHSAITRAQPIVLTGLAAMLGAFFILDDPIFNGLAISLIFGIFVSTVLTLVVIPTLYYAAYRHRLGRAMPSGRRRLDRQRLGAPAQHAAGQVGQRGVAGLLQQHHRLRRPCTRPADGDHRPAAVDLAHALRQVRQRQQPGAGDAAQRVAELGRLAHVDHLDVAGMPAGGALLQHRGLDLPDAAEGEGQRCPVGLGRQAGRAIGLAAAQVGRHRDVHQLGVRQDPGSACSRRSRPRPPRRPGAG